MDIPLKLPMRDVEKPYVRIRGIYTTALTKLFLDNNFEIVQPSEEIRARFELEEKNYSPHIDVNDLPNRQGIIVESLPKYTKSVIKLLQENFDDAIFRYEPVQNSAIYKAVIYRPSPWGGLILKLTPNLEGVLPQNELEYQKFSIGDPIIVEVKDPKGEHGLPTVSTKISVPGEFAVLIPEETVKVSHKIKGQTRSKLIELGHVIRPDGWGIIWRTSAMYADLEILKEEIDRLVEEAKKLMEISKTAPALTKVREGLDIFEVEFPANSKKKLDKIRSKVFPTVDGHHSYKSSPNNFTELVDFSEKILSKYFDISRISEALREYVKKYSLPREGELVKIHHRKINGREIILGPARLIKIVEENGFPEFRMFRRFKPGGFYDGIEAQKEVGDFGITLARIGDDKLITVYYDLEKKLKGVYLNLNTPIEMYGREIRYIDLEIDVVINVNGEVKILDSKRLENYYRNGNISEKLYTTTIKKAEEYKDWLESDGLNEIVEKCESVIELAEEQEESLEQFE